MSADSLPRTLEPIEGPLHEAIPERAVAGLGEHGKLSRGLLEAGRVPPSALTGMTLHLLSSQPRRPRPEAGAERSESGASGGVGGGVWVREQITLHAPVHSGEPLEVRGEIARAYTRKGRQYSTTWSQTRGIAGALRVSSCTTGLLRYAADASLGERASGREEGEIPVPGPDPAHAAENPGAPALRALRVGDELVGAAVPVGLELMRALDGGRAANPIHTDPEAARAAGLRAPIVAGSQQLAFVQEHMMEAWHPEVLLYGAHFDVRFRVPVYAGQVIEPFARVTRLDARGVELELSVTREGERSMVGRAVIPLA